MILKIVSLLFAVISTVIVVIHFDASMMEAILIGISYGMISQM